MNILALRLSDYVHIAIVSVQLVCEMNIPAFGRSHLQNHFVTRRGSSLCPAYILLPIILDLQQSKRDC